MTAHTTESAHQNGGVAESNTASGTHRGSQLDTENMCPRIIRFKRAECGNTIWSQILEAHNFRRLGFSNILWKQFSRIKDLARNVSMASIRYSKILRSLIFEVRCQSAKKPKLCGSKIWRCMVFQEIGCPYLQPHSREEVNPLQAFQCPFLSNWFHTDS